MSIAPVKPLDFLAGVRRPPCTVRGMAVWPAAQVLAQGAAAYAVEAQRKQQPLSAVELGDSGSVGVMA